MNRYLLRILMITAALLIAACGTVATPPPVVTPRPVETEVAEEQVGTPIAQAETEAEETETPEETAEEEAVDEPEVAEAEAAEPTEEAVEDQDEPEVAEAEAAEPTEEAVEDQDEPEVAETEAVEPTEEALDEPEVAEAEVVEPTEEAVEDVAEPEAAEADVEFDPLAVALAVGDPDNGSALFIAQYALPDGQAWACASCHSVTPDGARLIGPGQWNVSARAYLEEVDQNGAEYIRSSILHPLDYIAPPGDGQPDWALNMPGGWDEVFSEEELDDLTAYLITLRDDPIEPATAEEIAAFEAASASDEAESDADMTEADEPEAAAETEETEAVEDSADTETAEAEADGDPIEVALANGDPDLGSTVFNSQYTLPDGQAWACASCHSVTPDGGRLIGPGQWNVINRPYIEELDQNGVEYITNSILHPLDYIAPPGDGQPDWALNMPEGWDEVLSEDDLNNLVAYLVTLRD